MSGRGEGPGRLRRRGGASSATRLAVLALGAGVVLAGSPRPGPSAPAPEGTTGPPVVSAAPRDAQLPDTFPHLEHDGLFPLCTGCHEGIPVGDEAEYYPEAESCNGCHDGVEADPVDWSPPGPDDPDLLSFAHPAHVDAVAAEGDAPLDCRTCHAPGAEERIVVRPLEGQGSCLTCHAHEAADHYADADCATCHIPLAESRLSMERIAGLPAPASHDGSDAFILEAHAAEAEDDAARCATCHTRDVCTSCHVSGGERVIERLASAPPTMVLPPPQPRYPEPASHQVDGYRLEHAETAESAQCATCHTRDDCASCHLEPLPRMAEALPARSQVRAPGVRLEVEAPPTHAVPWFLDDHTGLAAASDAQCATCHTQPFCAECHEAPQRPAFHPENYLAQHGADAWGGMSTCQNCHEVETTCRSCHAQTGREARGRLGPGYHDAEPLWLLRHGQAARQSLEACASCHTQRNCLQCHSTLGAFQVSPHGSGLDLERAREKNPTICRACHVGDPFGGG